MSDGREISSEIRFDDVEYAELPFRDARQLVRSYREQLSRIHKRKRTDRHSNSKQIRESFSLLS